MVFSCCWFYTIIYNHLNINPSSVIGPTTSILHSKMSSTRIGLTANKRTLEIWQSLYGFQMIGKIYFTNRKNTIFWFMFIHTLQAGVPNKIRTNSKYVQQVFVIFERSEFFSKKHAAFWTKNSIVLALQFELSQVILFLFHSQYTLLFLILKLFQDDLFHFI